MKRRSAKEVVEILLDVSKKDFGPKSAEKRRKRHFRIARSHLLELSGRGRIDDQFYHEIQDRLQYKGYSLVDLADNFAITEVDPMTRYRKLPKDIVETYTGGKPSKKEKKIKLSSKKKKTSRNHKLREFSDRDEE